MEILYKKPILRSFSERSGLFCGAGTGASGSHDTGQVCQIGNTNVSGSGPCADGGTNFPPIYCNPTGSGNSETSYGTCNLGIAISDSGNNCDEGFSPGS